MKTEEELNALKEEVETLSKKLCELNEEELAQVTGGVAASALAVAGGKALSMGLAGAYAGSSAAAEAAGRQQARHGQQARQRGCPIASGWITRCSTKGNDRMRPGGSIGVCA